MPTFRLTKDIDGKLCGVDEKSNRAYARFVARLQGLTARDSLGVSWTEPRSGPYHRRHFVMLSALFQAQERFTDSEVFRKWGEMEAGYCDTVPGKDGPQKIPRSINYDAMDQMEFETLHNAVFAFYRTEYALMVLYPHLTWQQAYDMVDAVLREFER